MQKNRKHKFIDPIIQGYFIAFLIAFEFILILASLFYLYSNLSTHINVSIYSVKQAKSVMILEVMTGNLAQVVGVILVCNLIMMLVVRILWRRYINAVRLEIRQISRKVKNLDFSLTLADKKLQHPVITQLYRWYHFHQGKLQRITDAVESIASEEVDKNNSGRLYERIVNLKKVINN